MRRTLLFLCLLTVAACAAPAPSGTPLDIKLPPPPAAGPSASPTRHKITIPDVRSPLPFCVYPHQGIVGMKLILRASRLQAFLADALKGLKPTDPVRKALARPPHIVLTLDQDAHVSFPKFPPTGDKDLDKRLEAYRQTNLAFLQNLGRVFIGVHFNGLYALAPYKKTAQGYAFAVGKRHYLVAPNFSSAEELEGKTLICRDRFISNGHLRFLAERHIYSHGHEATLLFGYQSFNGYVIPMRFALSVADGRAIYDVVKGNVVREKEHS
ncbi:MAG: hypothetical protein ACYCW6_18135 [Candidatus Xenobia bacterium]